MKFLSLFLFAFIVSNSVYAESIVIKAGKLLDPVSGKIMTDQMLLIEDEKITKIAQQLDIPGKAKVIDLTHATVLPGMIDAHTHLCWDYELPYSSNPLSIMNTPTAYRALQGAYNANGMLQSGFTSVRDLGNAGHYADAALKRAISRDLVPGPDMMIAGRLITTFGGQKRLNADNKEMYGSEYFFADTRDELKKAIRENIHFGADVIKIIISDQRYGYSLEDIKFIVAEAKASGLDVAAHAMNDGDIRNAVLGGVRTIEHGFKIEEKTFDLLKKYNVYYVSTTFPKEVISSMYPARKSTNSSSENRYQDMVKQLRLAFLHKVKVAFGSDVVSTMPGLSRGEATLLFIDSFKDANASPLQIIQAMTINAAEALNKHHEIGLLKEGYTANIIAVEKNPLDDIDQLKQVAFVMKNGQVYKSTF